MENLNTNQVLTDEQLLAKFRNEMNENEKQKSFRIIYEKHKEYVLNTIRTKMSKEKPEEIEDMSQDFWEKFYIFLNKQDTNNIKNFKSYISTFIKNMIIDKYRKNRKNPTIIELIDSDGATQELDYPDPLKENNNLNLEQMISEIKKVVKDKKEKKSKQDIHFLDIFDVWLENLTSNNKKKSNSELAMLCNLENTKYNIYLFRLKKFLKKELEKKGYNIDSFS